MERIGCKMLSNMFNLLARRSVTNTNITHWKNLKLSVSSSSLARTVPVVSQVKLEKFGDVFDSRLLYDIKLCDKMVHIIKGTENHDMRYIPLQHTFPIQCPVELPVPVIEVEVPSYEVPMEKQAARLIVIRRRKMKKHKLRKLRKRMKYEWAKIRQKREMRKEKLFQAKLIQQIKEGEKFSAEEYVAVKLKKAYEPDITHK